MMRWWQYGWAQKPSRWWLCVYVRERGNERQREMGLREWTKWMNERLVETTTTMLICHAYNWLLLLLLLLWVYRVYICNQYWHCPYVWMVYSYANTKGSYVCRMSTIEVHIYIFYIYNNMYYYCNRWSGAVCSVSLWLRQKPCDMAATQSCLHTIYHHCTSTQIWIHFSSPFQCSHT